MSWFPEYTIESAPADSRRFMVATETHLGYLPAATARWAASPHLLEGFAKLNAIFENGTLEPLAREVVVMTIATRNGCHVCVAMHTARLTALGASADLIAALRDALAAGDSPLSDERLDAIRVFTRRVLDTAGDVGDDALRTFVASGYTRQHALEVVLGIGTYTMSTLANRLTDAPVDDQLSPFAWHTAAASVSQLGYRSYGTSGRTGRVG
jgi:AhpD family alkylhydroperoxidase